MKLGNILQNLYFISVCSTDVDECETGEHNCDQNCTVDGVWFNCSCEDGYTLHEDGHTCVGQ